MTEWTTIINQIFTIGIPKFAEWDNNNEIINVLNKIGSFKNSNHMFYPDGGGMDLESASQSFERNCIEINTGFNEILSPKRLTFHSFPNLDWSYFRLELNEIKKTGVYSYQLDFREELCELEPLHYVSREHWDTHEYNYEPLPEGSRLIERRLKGSLLIVGKGSRYNEYSPTYDGRHDKYSDTEFREYLENVQRQGWRD